MSIYINRDLPNDEYQAAIGANNPSAANVFATIADLTAATSSTDKIIFDVKYNQVGGLVRGQAVYVNGADGTNITVGKADYTTEATSSKTLGLVVTTGPNNFQGQVIAEGLLDNLDTSAAGAAGDPVWLGPNGTLLYGLVNKPYAPNHLVFIGIVTKKNPSTGEIFVKVQNGFELKEIHDVDLITNAPTDGQVLTYDNGTGLWKNEDLPAVIGASINPSLDPVIENTITDPSTLDPEFGDSYLVPIGATGTWLGQDNNIATSDGTDWLYYTPSVGDITTVLTGANAGNVYEFDGLNWTLVATTSTTATPFFLSGSSVDAGGNKTANIARAGRVTLGSNSGPLYNAPLTVRASTVTENLFTRAQFCSTYNAALVNTWYRVAFISINNTRSGSYKILFSEHIRGGLDAFSAIIDIAADKAGGGNIKAKVTVISTTQGYTLTEDNFKIYRNAAPALGPLTIGIYYRPTVVNAQSNFTLLNALTTDTQTGVRWYNTNLGATITDTIFDPTNRAIVVQYGIKNNYTATVNPTVTDDLSLNYWVGSAWVNTVTDKSYICTDSTVGAAVWKQITNEIPFIPPLEQSEIRRGVIAISSSTATGAIGGITPALTGSAVAVSFGGTVPLPKLRLLTTTGTTNSTVGIITGSSNVIYRIGRGFRFIGSYIYSDQSAGGTNWFVPGALQFCGLVSGATLLNISSANTVETRTNLIGIGSDSTDTNLQMFHNDASGNCTKIDLGSNFPANKTGAVANGEAYQLELYNEFGSTDVKYRVRRLSDGVEVTGTINSNIPSGATDLGPQIVRSSGSTSQNVSIDIIQLTAYTRE